MLDGKGEAYCKACKVHLRAHRGHLEKHATTVARHKEKMAALNRAKQPSLEAFGKDMRYPLISETTFCTFTFITVYLIFGLRSTGIQVASDEEKATDCKLAVFIAMYCPVRTIDHLGEMLKELGKGSKLERLRMHRTKCSKVISNVIAPEFLKEMLNDVGDSPFAVICDEATDNSSAKFMGVCIRYYSKLQKDMVTDFLGLIPVTTCTGEALASALKGYLENIGLPMKHMTSVGTDGAPNMCGHVNSFYTHLKKDVPGLQLFKCVCHSLDKCTE